MPAYNKPPCARCPNAGKYDTQTCTAYCQWKKNPYTGKWVKNIHKPKEA